MLKWHEERDLWSSLRVGFNVAGLFRLRGVSNCKLSDLNQAAGGGGLCLPPLLPHASFPVSPPLTPVR